MLVGWGLSHMHVKLSPVFIQLSPNHRPKSAVDCSGLETIEQLLFNQCGDVQKVRYYQQGAGVRGQWTEINSRQDVEVGL